LCSGVIILYIIEILEKNIASNLMKKLTLKKFMNLKT
jgi:hypothetical protein